MLYADIPVGSIFYGKDQTRPNERRKKTGPGLNQWQWVIPGNGHPMSVNERYTEWIIDTAAGPPRQMKIELHDYIILISEKEGAQWTFSCAFETEKEAYKFAKETKENFPASGVVVTKIIASADIEVSINERDPANAGLEIT
jgi:hypothetical protein